MAYIPDIIDYRPFYIQTDAEEGAIDTTTWGMVAKSNPFAILPEPKEVYKNTWLDEDGDEEYTKEMYYKSLEIEVQFYVKTIGGNAEATLISQIEGFFEKVRDGEFMIFDSYTGLGRQKVRYAGFDEEDFKKRFKSSVSWARAIFTIKFKVNDPTTRVELSGGKLVTV